MQGRRFLHHGEHLIVTDFSVGWLCDIMCIDRQCDLSRVALADVEVSLSELSELAGFVSSSPWFDWRIMRAVALAMALTSSAFSWLILPDLAPRPPRVL